jgi:hypothetical protein
MLELGELVFVVGSLLQHKEYFQDPREAVLLFVVHRVQQLHLQTL